MSTVFKHQYDTSHLQGANATYVEWLYEQYLAEPGSVPSEWRQYFSTLAAPNAEIPHGPIVQAVAERTRQRGASAAATATRSGNSVTSRHSASENRARKASASGDRSTNTSNGEYPASV